jgi:hypothetical protein
MLTLRLRERFYTFCTQTAGKTFLNVWPFLDYLQQCPKSFIATRTPYTYPHSLTEGFAKRLNSRWPALAGQLSRQGVPLGFSYGTAQFILFPPAPRCAFAVKIFRMNSWNSRYFVYIWPVSILRKWCRKNSSSFPFLFSQKSLPSRCGSNDHASNEFHYLLLLPE